MVKTIASLEELIGYSFRNKKLLIQALTHRTYAYEHRGYPNNQRMEFLGDSVLGLCIDTLLMSIFVDEQEGNLTKINSFLVSEEHLIEIAGELKLEEYILLGKTTPLVNSMLADAVEAVIGAIYLDSNFYSALEVVKQLFDLANLKSVDEIVNLDHKSMVQEIIQGRKMPLPRYVCVEEAGPQHSREFTMALFVENREIARGKGVSKKQATKNAAKNAIETYGPKLELLLK